MLRIIDLLSPEDIGLDVRAMSKKHVLLELARMLATRSGLLDTPIFQALADRENLGTTGFGQGIAVPHARLRELGTTHAALVRLAEPVDFDAGDDRPVDLVCAIIGPEGSTQEPFEALVSACRVLRNPETLAKLRQAGSAAAVHSILAEAV
ncbi:PTS sugar transporter subunit IIA [Mesorhizobium sp. AaZ16]|uniref:PTS sugar transporter subunit IIA n=1 Tax=Mesorhizobium sp. AaZ16 TaxID=3402289 RepID=UPI00374E4B26